MRPVGGAHEFYRNQKSLSKRFFVILNINLIILYYEI